MMLRGPSFNGSDAVQSCNALASNAIWELVVQTNLVLAKGEDDPDFRTTVEYSDWSFAPQCWTQSWQWQCDEVPSFLPTKDHYEVWSHIFMNGSRFTHAMAGYSLRSRLWWRTASHRLTKNISTKTCVRWVLGRTLVDERRVSYAGSEEGPCPFRILNWCCPL